MPLELVSVVIPCYNQGHFLGEAIESVRAQTYPCVEIIVVDDGSTDDTAAIARAAGTRYIYQANAGLASARNLGFRTSQGDYLVFLDADDRLLPDAIQAGWQALRDYPEAAIVYGGYRNVTVDGAEVCAVQRSMPRGADPFLLLLQENVIGMHGAVTYRRDVLAKMNGFNPALRRCEDYDLYLRIAREYPIHSHGEVVAEYRRHSQSMSNDHVGMLTHALGILRGQRDQVRDSPEYMAAWQSGMRNWRLYYGSKMISDVAVSLERRAWGSVARTSLEVLRHNPRGLISEGSRVVHRLLNRRRSTGKVEDLPESTAATRAALPQTRGRT
jgi:glycosyltransferase involved in cell wall biosynthesis